MLGGGSVELVPEVIGEYDRAGNVREQHGLGHGQDGGHRTAMVRQGQRPGSVQPQRSSQSTQKGGDGSVLGQEADVPSSDRAVPQPLACAAHGQKSVHGLGDGRGRGQIGHGLAHRGAQDFERGDGSLGVPLLDVPSQVPACSKLQGNARIESDDRKCPAYGSRHACKLPRLRVAARRIVDDGLQHLGLAIVDEPIGKADALGSGRVRLIALGGGPRRVERLEVAVDQLLDLRIEIREGDLHLGRPNPERLCRLR